MFVTGKHSLSILFCVLTLNVGTNLWKAKTLDLSNLQISFLDDLYKPYHGEHDSQEG